MTAIHCCNRRSRSLSTWGLGASTGFHAPRRLYPIHRLPTRYTPTACNTNTTTQPSHYTNEASKPRIFAIERLPQRRQRMNDRYRRHTQHAKLGDAHYAGIQPSSRFAGYAMGGCRTIVLRLPSRDAAGCRFEQYRIKTYLRLGALRLQFKLPGAAMQGCSTHGCPWRHHHSAGELSHFPW